MERLDRRDWTFLAVCAALSAIFLWVALANFTRAFPEASIDFRYDRSASRPIAEALLEDVGADVRGYRSAVLFDSDDTARIFLERSLGMEEANQVMRRDVRVWFWHHRWFKPLEEEEYSVSVAPTGEIVSYAHTIPEDRRLPETDLAGAREIAQRFLRRVGVDPALHPQIDQSERRLPGRTQRIFTWESESVRPAGSAYRYRVSVDGNVVTEYAQSLRVPDEWKRSYQALRSKNHLAGQVDTVFLGITVVAALVVFVSRLRRRDVHLRFLLVIIVVSVVLVTGVALNSFPTALAEYDTTSSFGAFLSQFAIGSVLQSFGTAMFLVVICGAGEVLYRERYPSHLAVPRLAGMAALRSRRVFKAFVLGYTMVAAFIAYQVVFYIVASKFGAWSPADIPYHDILSSAIPWVAVLFAGFFPAMSEEFLSRAFSIPFFEKVFRSRIAAIVIAGFVWGFGHATYPNQPFYIRGVEVGVAGVILGFLMHRFGILPLLIWHYTIDAVYTALLLVRSGNPYYVFSAGTAALVFAIPMLASIGMYLRHGGFLPDQPLSNETIPLTEPPPAPPPRPTAELPPPLGVTRWMAVALVVALAAAAAFTVFDPPSPDDVIDYRITRDEAKTLAASHVRSVMPRARWERAVAAPIEGFRSWNPHSTREEGGAPSGFDAVAAEHMLASGMSMKRLLAVFRHEIPAGNWSVRLFTPMKKEEYIVEVDPRTSRIAGFHKYHPETAPGAALDREEALAIALRALPGYGVEPAHFDLKEALAFQQPARRDWLFHFQARRPLVDEAYRRVTVRVCGTEVTQFANWIRVPDSVHRLASTQTVRNVVVMVLVMAGGIAILALAVAGFIAATQKHPRWLVAMRWTAVVAPLVVLGVVADYESRLFSYATSVQWETYLAGFWLNLAKNVAVRLAAVFLAFVTIDAWLPWAFDATSAEGRRRFGRSAAVAALTAVASFVVMQGLLQLAASAFPRSADVSVGRPDLVAIPLPSLTILANGIVGAVVGAGAAAAFAGGLTALEKRPATASIVTVAALFFATLSISATPRQMPLMILRSAGLALLLWILSRKVLGRNALAWPLALGTAIVLDGAGTLASSQRPDLVMNLVVLLVVLAAVYAWLLTQPRRAAG